MKLLVITVVTALPLIGLAGLAIYSHQLTPETGLVDGQLKACPDSPNCVCSEEGSAGPIRPILLKGHDHQQLWLQLTAVVEALGGRVTIRKPDYLHAEFVTPLFRFVDDFEARLDADGGLIHVRSASRVGRSDLGTNARRIEEIRVAFEQASGSSERGAIRP